jgi:hypothetical protein
MDMPITLIQSLHIVYLCWNITLYHNYDVSINIKTFKILKTKQNKKPSYPIILNCYTQDKMSWHVTVTPHSIKLSPYSSPHIYINMVKKWLLFWNCVLFSMSIDFFLILFIVLGGGTLWHLQKFLQCIKYIILEFTPPPFSSILPSPFLE